MKDEPLNTADPAIASAASAAILIVAYNGMRWLEDCLASIFAAGDEIPAAQIVLVDNASTDGTPEWVREKYPCLTLIGSQENLGFAGGNNVGYTEIRRRFPQVRYVALLNQDTIVRPKWLSNLVQLLESDASIASAQVKLLLHPETNLLNSAGNRSHYLGFGFTSAYREEDCGQYDRPHEIAFCSGAAMLLRISALNRADLFDPTYFAYLEDAELGWYFRIRGYRNLYCPAAVVHHRYAFSRNPQMYYRLERNRYQLIFSYYKLLTILLLLPMILAMEGGLLFYFLKTGAMRQKLRSWDSLAELGSVRAKRRRIAGARKISDRQLTSLFISKADFEEVRNPLLQYVGNPLLRIYWQTARLLLWW